MKTSMLSERKSIVNIYKVILFLPVITMTDHGIKGLHFLPGKQAGLYNLSGSGSANLNTAMS